MELPDLYHIEYLTEAAANGDEAAMKELGQINERLARAANQRLRRLEKAGKTNDAYKRIVEELGGKKRLLQHKNVTEETAASIGRNAERALRALKMKETTITSIKETDRKTVESLMKHFNMDVVGSLAGSQEARRHGRHSGYVGLRAGRRRHGTGCPGV